MSQHHPAPAQVCPNCAGFPAVRVSLGGRDRTAPCPACHGIGLRHPACADRQVTA